jgi:hypothetical protein
MITDQQKQWMAQWRIAARELERVKRLELAEMTDEEALKATHDLLSLAQTAYKAKHFRTYSGLVEQQRWFKKLAKT